ncbi:kelch-like protein 38 [Ptychodera flava]|uniref:kelch-like protein 38 n=1 Tax=Ptychodera flava TaxID=63121 RepID=UPI00396A866E
MGCVYSKQRDSTKTNVKRVIQLERQLRHANDRDLQAIRQRSGQHLRQLSIDKGLHLVQYTDILEEIMKANDLKVREGLMRSHGRALLGRLNELRCRQLFTDFTLICKDGIAYPCHRVVISAVSGVLQEQCLVTEADPNDNTTTLDDTDSRLVKGIMEYIYTGRYDLNRENAAASYKLATDLKMTQFEEVCWSAKVFLSNNINESANWDGFNKDYVVYFLKEINRLRLNGLFTDVVVETSEHKIKCHRSVLAACSGFFRVLFSTNFEDSISDTVYLRDTHADSVKMLIDFAYTGDIDIDASTAEDLLRVANQLQWSEIELLAQSFIEKQIDVSNCIGISYFADIFNYTELSRKARQYATGNFDEVTRQGEFLSLSIEQVISFLEEDTVYDCEDTVLDAIGRWIKYDQENRSRFARDLLQFVIEENLSDDMKNNLHESHPVLASAMSEITATQNKTRYYTEVVVFFGSYETDHRQRNIDVYNPETKTWSSLSKLPRSADPFVSSAVPIGDKVWVSTLKRTTWMYSLPTDNWKEVRSQPGRLLSQYAAVSHNGYIYVIGGSDDKTNNVKAMVDRYDPRTDTWSMMSPMPLAVGTKAAVVWKSNIFVFGGWNGDTYTHRVQCYDVINNKWKFVSRCPVGDTCGIAVVALGNFIFVFESGDTFRYDPGNDSWRQMKSMNHRRTDFTAVVCTGKIYVIGGVYLGQPVRNVECYQQDSDTWSVTDSFDDITIFSYPRSVAVQKKHIRKCTYDKTYHGGFVEIEQVDRSYHVTKENSEPSVLLM